MGEEWIRWLFGTVLSVVAAVSAAYLRATWEMRQGDSRLHQRIDALVKERNDAIAGLRDEIRKDASSAASAVARAIDNLRDDSNRFREKVFDELQKVSSGLSRIEGILQRADNENGGL